MSHLTKKFLIFLPLALPYVGIGFYYDLNIFISITYAAILTLIIEVGCNVIFVVLKTSKISFVCERGCHFKAKLISRFGNTGLIYRHQLPLDLQ